MSAPGLELPGALYMRVIRAPAFVSSSGPVLPPLLLRAIVYGEGPRDLSQTSIGLAVPFGATKSSAWGPAMKRTPDASRSLRWISVPGWLSTGLHQPRTFAT